MRYILDERYRFRGWYKLPTGVFDTIKKEAKFFDGDSYRILLRCDGAHDFEPASLNKNERKLIELLEKDGVIRLATDVGGLYSFLPMD